MATDIAACAERAKHRLIDRVRVQDWNTATQAALEAVPGALVAQHTQTTTRYGGLPRTIHEVTIARPELLVHLCTNTLSILQKLAE